MRREMSSVKVKIYGWLCFLLSAIAFTISGVRAGNVSEWVGGIVLFMGCTAQLASLFYSVLRPADKGGSDARKQ